MEGREKHARQGESMVGGRAVESGFGQAKFEALFEVQQPGGPSRYKPQEKRSR